MAIAVASTTSSLRMSRWSSGLEQLIAVANPVEILVKWDTVHRAPPKGISWNHQVHVIDVLDALTGEVTTFSHIVTGIP